MALRLRNEPSCSGLTGDSPGSRSCNAERISTRLIESIPRSASSCMSRSSTGAGYPVFSETTSIRMAVADSAVLVAPADLGVAGVVAIGGAVTRSTAERGVWASLGPVGGDEGVLPFEFPWKLEFD